MSEPPVPEKSVVVALIQAIASVIIALVSGKTIMTAIVSLTMLVGWLAYLLPPDKREAFIIQGGAARSLELLAAKALASWIIPVSGWLVAGMVSAVCYWIHRAQHQRIQAQGEELARLRDSREPGRVSSRRIEDASQPSHGGDNG